MNRSIMITSTALALIEEYGYTDTKVETGGMLYGKMNPTWVYIEDIGKPGPKALQSRARISFDMDYVLAESIVKAQDHLFVVGTWHTHPPYSSLSPSPVDIAMMKSLNAYFLSSMLPVFCIASCEMNNFRIQFYEMSDRYQTMKHEIIN